MTERPTEGTIRPTPQKGTCRFASLENVFCSCKEHLLGKSGFPTRKILPETVGLISGSRHQTTERQIVCEPSPCHSPLSMEDVQHYNQPAHDQQHSHGQRDNQMHEVFIRRCRHRGTVNRHSVHKLLISFFFFNHSAGSIGWVGGGRKPDNSCAALSRTGNSEGQRYQKSAQKHRVI